jgi:hypothetical protein
MTEVMSRPASIREVDEDSDRGSAEASSEDGDTDTEHEGGQGTSSASINDIAALLRRKPSDVRSIRSVTSMMSSTGPEEGRGERLSISDRFANLSGLTKSSTSTPADSVPAPKVSCCVMIILPSADASLQPQGLSGASNTPRNPLGRRTTWSTPLELEPSLTPRSRESPILSPLLASPQLAADNPDVGPPLDRFMTCAYLFYVSEDYTDLAYDCRRLVGSQAVRSRRAVARLPTTGAFAGIADVVRLNRWMRRNLVERGISGNLKNRLVLRAGQMRYGGRLENSSIGSECGRNLAGAQR